MGVFFYTFDSDVFLVGVSRQPNIPNKPHKNEYHWSRFTEDRPVLCLGIQPFGHTDFPRFSGTHQPGHFVSSRRNILILDKASWRKSKSFDWGRFEPIFLPPYSPDLNSVERLWLIMKAEWFSGFYAKSRDELIDHLSQVLRWFINRKDENAKTCAIPTEI
jgi:hypothetical protein